MLVGFCFRSEASRIYTKQPVECRNRGSCGNKGIFFLRNKHFVTSGRCCTARREEAGWAPPGGVTECRQQCEVSWAQSIMPSWRYFCHQTLGPPTLCNGSGCEKQTACAPLTRSVTDSAGGVQLAVEIRPPRWCRGYCYFFSGL